MPRIKGRRYAEGQRYCDICDNLLEDGNWYYCSERCAELARKYGRKRAREIIKEQ